MSTFEIRQGDVLDRLREMPDESVHCVVTSPPYFGLRSYGVEGQMGLEPSVDAYLEKMVEVFREVRRVLRSDGSAWVNLGDSFMGKQLQMIPARLALALQADGWWIRSEITWCKRAPMPESVRDRPTSATEKIYLLTKSATYYFDNDAIREPSQIPNAGDINRDDWQPKEKDGIARPTFKVTNREYHPMGRNSWNYWILSPDPYAEAHFATFPKEIPRRAILAGTSQRGVCGACGAPWKRVLGEGTEVKDAFRNSGRYVAQPHGVSNGSHDGGTPRAKTGGTTIGWAATCPCSAPTVPATVLDCFSGAGTTGLVAVQLGRRYIGLELNQEYIDMSLKRIHREGAPLFAWADGQGQAQEDPNSQAVG